MQKLHLHSLGMRDVRVVNELRLLNVIRQNQPISRIQISHQTGLNASTVTMIVKRLLTHDMITEGTLGPSTGGRRPTFLTINPNKMFVLGVDLGLRHTSYAISDFNGRQVLWRTIPTVDESEQFLVALCEDIRQHAGPARLFKHKQLSAVGVSVPELVDVQEGSMILGREHGWEKIPVRSVIEQCLGLPTFVENDASAAALGEIWLGSTKLLGYRNIVYVLVVEGIGTGLIVEGRLYRGSPIGAGGFGHMLMDPDGPPCICGGRGCWEAMASERALQRHYSGSVKQGPSSENSTEAADIVDAALRGDRAAIHALTQTAKYIGLGILSLIHGLSPQAIVVGGNVARAWDILGPVIQETVHSRFHIPSLAAVEIMPSSVPNPPSLFGAVAVALSSILEQEVAQSPILRHATVM
jgi:predicted NBD/HSP70 family sugar kinase